MNILFSTVGRRGYLVKFFRELLTDEDAIFGADISPNAPGLVYCDHKALFPKITDPDYVDTVLSYCVSHQIDVLIPLLDPELGVLAAAKSRFDENNVMVVVSPLKTVELSFDKYLTYLFGKENEIDVPLAFLQFEEAVQAVSSGMLSWPLVVKPRRGSASQDISFCDNELQLREAFERCPNPMIQEFLEGDEYGYDLFGDADYRPISVFCKKKLSMRAGETDKAVSTDDHKLIAFGKKILESLQIFGPCDVDVIVTEQGPKLLEINPRFGGGYPCSHLAGANYPQKLLSMRDQQQLVPDIGSCPANVVMLKQDEIICQAWSEDMESVHP
jgi:carbamoyl-phosphate synthase large subunit